MIDEAMEFFWLLQEFPKMPMDYCTTMDFKWDSPQINSPQTQTGKDGKYEQQQDAPSRLSTHRLGYPICPGNRGDIKINKYRGDSDEH